MLNNKSQNHIVVWVGRTLKDLSASSDTLPQAGTACTRKTFIRNTQEIKGKLGQCELAAE